MVPDLTAATQGLIRALGPLAGAALRALVGTAAGMLLLGIATTAAAAWLAAGGSVARGLLAGALCLALGVVVGGALAVKSAVLRGLLAGAVSLGLGKKAVALLFDALGVGPARPAVESAGAVERLAGRLPLAEAEGRLRGAVEGVLRGRAEQRGMRAWLARGLLAALLERIEWLTLARFRAEGAAHGGVDLHLVRDELGESIDRLLADQLSSQARRLTIAAAGLYVAAGLLIGAGVARLDL